MRFWLAAGAINGFLGVALGAFAAHGLKQRLEPRLFDIWEVGVRYHMYHALALLAVALLVGRVPAGQLNLAGYAFLVGIILFCGSLYALALTNVRVLGAITPFGGLGFLAGWLILAFAAFKLPPATP
jgi:uncharacterized membrane protein YgdD (TMEM256/DUF423 family)